MLLSRGIVIHYIVLCCCFRHNCTFQKDVDRHHRRSQRPKDNDSLDKCVDLLPNIITVQLLKHHGHNQLTGNVINQPDNVCGL